MSTSMMIILLISALKVPSPVAIPQDEPDWSQAIEASISTLVSNQESMDRSDAKSKKQVEVREWPYEGVYREGGQIPPGYRVGGTAIVMRSLIEVPGLKKDSARANSVMRGLSFLLQESLRAPRMGVGFSGGYDVRDWGHIESLETILRMQELAAIPSKLKKPCHQLVEQLISTLVENEIASGGWNYSRRRRAGASSPASPFMTAPAVLALMRARDHGYKFDLEVIERALDTLEAARLESGAFQYSTNPDRVTGEGFEAVQGACARMAVCETALWLAGRADAKRVRSSVEAFLEHWEWLEKRRAQTGTHNPPYYIAPYYFFYAHTHAARALQALPEEEREPLRQRILARLWQVRGEDNSWNDRVFPRSSSYGTAMTILAIRGKESPLPKRVAATTPKAKQTSKKIKEEQKPSSGTSL
ncbi:MAG: terpene cyclase/mutase family protein [Planctomycetota bacterium]|nr:terpene cyclase/mutase family protein [Planctomycetota bacterium]